MAKMVDCKSCKKEVAQYARTCPHCGQKNPTINMLVATLIFFGIPVLIAWLILG